MENIKAFLEGIHVDAKVLEKLESEEKLTDEELESLTEEYIDGRNSYYEAQNLKKIESDSKKAGISSYQINERKKWNKLLGLGLSNSQMDEYADNMDDYYKVIDKALKARVDDLKNDVSQATKDEIDRLRTQLSEESEKREMLENSREEFETTLKSEFTKKQQLTSAKAAYSRLEADIRKNLVSDLPGDTLDRLLKSYENELFTNYTVNEDLTILDKETGGKAKHLDANIKNVPKHAKDILEWQVRDLVKKNNAGERPKVLNVNKDQPIVVNGGEPTKLSPAAMEKLKRYEAQGLDINV